jgi:predicted dehydrogenase
VAENVKEAEKLIQWYRSEVKGPTWVVAENWRFLASYHFAAEQIKTLGRITGFQGRQHGLMPLNWKFNRMLHFNLIFTSTIISDFGTSD